MLYTLPKSYSQAGTKVDIPDSELKTKRNALGSTKAAIDQWLFENGYMQEDEYAAELVIAQEGIVNKKASSRKRQPDEVKRGLIQALYSCLLDIDNTDNVTITQGNSATDAGADNKVHYYKEDTLTINGSPKKIYGPKALKNKNPIISKSEKKLIFRHFFIYLLSKDFVLIL